MTTDTHPGRGHEWVPNYLGIAAPTRTSTDIPRRVRDVLCTWQLVKAVFPRGRNDSSTKTYLHRHPDAAIYSVTRMIEGKLAGHVFLTDIEVSAIADLA